MIEEQDISEFGLLVHRLGLKVVELEEENTLLKQEIVLLQQENAELRGRLNKNSSNSNKPPSTDGMRKEPAIPKQKKGKTGGQFGHIGHTLKMVKEADHTVLHHAPNCSCCQRVFEPWDVEQIVHKRQVFDLPEPKLEVTEHQIGLIHCCGQAHMGSFPSGVLGPVQYGNRVKALVSLLNTEYRMPLEKIGVLFGELYDYKISDQTIIDATQDCYEALEQVEQEIKQAVLESEVAHFDETGMRVEGKLHWFHTACTTLVCYLFVHAKRGKEALLDATSVLKDFKNWAVHDCWSSYFDFEQCLHALCNAHIARELTALSENGTIWTQKMHQLLFELYELSKKGKASVDNQTYWEEQYKLICQQADLEEPPPIKGARGKPKNSKGRNLLNRLVKHQIAVLAFAFYDNIPFTNNQAERDIRHVKVKQKVAMSFRRFKGAQIYARIQSFVITARKQNHNSFKELCHILDGHKYHFRHT